MQPSNILHFQLRAPFAVTSKTNAETIVVDRNHQVVRVQATWFHCAASGWQ